MRRVVLLVLMLSFSFVLTACGGTADTSVADPPKSKVVEGTQNERINKIIDGWKQVVPTTMQNPPNNIKPPIEQKVYESTASLQEIAAFYDQLTTKGWTKSSGVPGLQNKILITGYEIGGQTDLVVGAVDESQVGGSGVVIYTAKGHK